MKQQNIIKKRKEDKLCVFPNVVNIYAISKKDCAFLQDTK